MSENADIVRMALEAWNRRDLEEMAKHVHPDLEWIEHHQMIGDADYRGPSAIGDVTNVLEEGFEDYRAEVVEVVEIDAQRLVAVLRESGRGVASGASFSTQFGYVVTMRDGKAARIEAYRDPREAFEAVGQRG